MMVHDGTSWPATLSPSPIRRSLPPLCWLAQVVYALLYPVGGWPLLQIVDNLMFASAFMIAAFSVRSSEARSTAVAAAMGLGFLVALPHNSLRPQTFALLGMALLLALRGSAWPTWSKIVAGAVILLLWQNLHPSVVVAGIVLAALLVADVWEWWRGEKPELLGVDAGLLACVAVAQFATPWVSPSGDSARNAPCREGRIGGRMAAVLGPTRAGDGAPILGPPRSSPSFLQRAAFAQQADAALLLAMAGLSAWMVRWAFRRGGAGAGVGLTHRTALPPELFADKPETHGPSRLIKRGRVVGILAWAPCPVMLRPASARTFRTKACRRQGVLMAGLQPPALRRPLVLQQPPLAGVHGWPDLCV